MAADIVEKLQRWLAELIGDKEFRQSSGELPGIEIALLSRAIDEIKRLRSAAAKARR